MPKFQTDPNLRLSHLVSLAAGIAASDTDNAFTVSQIADLAADLYDELRTEVSVHLRKEAENELPPDELVQTQSPL